MVKLINVKTIRSELHPVNFQSIIATLNQFWSDRGCLIAQSYDTEKGAGTMNPHTFLRAIAPNPGRSPMSNPVVVPPMAVMEKTPTVFNIIINIKC